MVSTDVDDASVLIRPIGDVDLETVPALTKALDEATGLHRTLLVVDLAESGFIDVSGLAAIDRAARIQADDGNHIVIINYSVVQRRLLVQGGLADHLG